MIELSRLNGKKFILNCELIKTLESTPDTVVTLTTGDKFMVLEPIEKIIAATISYRQALMGAPAVISSTAMATPATAMTPPALRDGSNVVLHAEARPGGAPPHDRRS